MVVNNSVGFYMNNIDTVDGVKNLAIATSFRSVSHNDDFLVL